MGAPIFMARSMILTILAALAPQSEPPKTVKSWAKTKTVPAVDPAVAGNHPVARDPLFLHAEVPALVDDQLVHLLERSLVEEQPDALPRRQLARLVLLLDPLGAAAQLGQAGFSP